MENQIIPAEYLPSIEDLPGELPRIATAAERVCPGQGVLVALELARSYPGQTIYIHSARALFRQVRDDAIRHRYDNGGKVSEIATECGLSSRQVERILSSAGRVDNRQLPLF